MTTDNPAQPTARAILDAKFARIHAVRARGITASRILQFLARHIRGKLGDNLLRWNESFHRLTLGRVATRGRNAAAELLDLHVQMVHQRAFLAYRPLPYGGKVTLFRTLDQRVGYEVEPDLGLGRGGAGRRRGSLCSRHSLDDFFGRERHQLLPGKWRNVSNRPYRKSNLTSFNARPAMRTTFPPMILNGRAVLA